MRAASLRWRRRLCTVLTQVSAELHSRDAEVSDDTWRRFELQQMQEIAKMWDSWCALLLSLSEAVVSAAVRSNWMSVTHCFVICAWLALSKWSRDVRVWNPHMERHILIGQQHLVVTARYICLIIAIMDCKNTQTVVAHRAFCMKFMVWLGTVAYCSYLPMRLRVIMMTTQSLLAWIVFHWIMDFLTPAPVLIGATFPILGLFLARWAEQKDWARFCLADKEKQGRLVSEALRKTLLGILNTTYDASCECDETGRILCASQNLQQQLGNSSCGLENSNLTQLAVNPTEMQRVGTFLKQILAQKRGDGLVDSDSPLVLLETTLWHPSSQLVHEVKLSGVALPTHCTASEAGINSPHVQRLFVGLQAVQPPYRRSAVAFLHEEQQLLDSNSRTCSNSRNSAKPLHWAQRGARVRAKSARHSSGSSSCGTESDKCHNESGKESEVSFTLTASSARGAESSSCSQRQAVMRVVSTQTEELATAFPRLPRPPFSGKKGPNQERKDADSKRAHERKDARKFRTSTRSPSTRYALTFDLFVETPSEMIWQQIIESAHSINPLCPPGCCNLHKNLRFMELHIGLKSKGLPCQHLSSDQQLQCVGCSHVQPIEDDEFCCGTCGGLAARQPKASSGASSEVQADDEIEF